MSMDFDHPTGNYIDGLLGRYEYTDEKSNKFYEVMYCGRSATDQPMFQVYWGRIGAKKPQGMQLDLYSAQSKIEEKKRKGYVYVSGSYKSLAQQRHEGMMEVVNKVRPSQPPEEKRPSPLPKM